ncbi:hypothetical protein LCGC14_0785660 [marine sediment metagenome]|uniref:GH16 domain-containing protein n=1 Tax=marine sediment metagenome TaxID=412755 RepID=A0A0F9PYE4_9ZZZZ|nr:hypothetical protein [Maribacter sp.]HDZ03413.1 hypothetical protein [Maribacter sp.]
MTAWKTILQHEFLDNNLRNFNSTEGILQTSNFPPRIQSDIPSGVNTLHLQQNRNWMKYIPKETIGNVIGIQIKCKLRIPHKNEIVTLEMFDLGQFKVNMVIHSHNTGKSLEVRYGGHLATIVNYPSNDTDYFGLEILWLPNGQLRIMINGQLELFRNNFGLNTRTTISKVNIGFDEEFVGPIKPHSYFINYLNIKVLREFDSSSEILDYFPSSKCPPKIPPRCLKKMLGRQSRITLIIRDFMAQFSKKYTNNWDEMNDNGEPISNVAKQAHIKAMQCGIAFKNAFEELDLQQKSGQLDKSHAAIF